VAHEPSDQELIARLYWHDHQALALLYDRHARSVYSLALYILRDRAAAEDVTQDVFLQLWRDPRQYQEERGQLGPWLLRITRNRAIDLLRRHDRQGRSRETDWPPLEPQLSDQAPELEEQVWSIALVQRLHEALSELNDAQRQVIELAYFRGMTQREMAEALGLPLGTVKTRVRSALRRLAEILTRDGVWSDVS